MYITITWSVAICVNWAMSALGVTERKTAAILYPWWLLGNVNISCNRDNRETVAPFFLISCHRKRFGKVQLHKSSFTAVRFKKLWVGMSYINFFDHPPLEFKFSAGYPLQNRKFLRTTHPQNFFHIFCGFSVTKSRKIPPTQNCKLLQTTPLQNRKYFQSIPKWNF